MMLVSMNQIAQIVLVIQEILIIVCIDQNNSNKKENIAQCMARIKENNEKTT